MITHRPGSKPHEFQDGRYGDKHRVCNKGKDNFFCCTVTGEKFKKHVEAEEKKK